MLSVVLIATGEYPISSADSNKAGSSNNVYSLAQSPANKSTGESLSSLAPSKLAKRQFTEKINSAEINFNMMNISFPCSLTYKQRCLQYATYTATI